MSVLAAGSEVPEFTLQREDGKRFTRDDLEGYRALVRELGLRK